MAKLNEENNSRVKLSPLGKINGEDRFKIRGIEGVGVQFNKKMGLKLNTKQSRFRQVENKQTSAQSSILTRSFQSVSYDGLAIMHSRLHCPSFSLYVL